MDKPVTGSLCQSRAGAWQEPSLCYASLRFGGGPLARWRHNRTGAEAVTSEIFKPMEHSRDSPPGSVGGSQKPAMGAAV
jgi:hypothetical protein